MGFRVKIRARARVIVRVRLRARVRYSCIVVAGVTVPLLLLVTPRKIVSGNILAHDGASDCL